MWDLVVILIDDQQLARGQQLDALAGLDRRQFGGREVRVGGERLAPFKVPKGATFLTELPKTATGKIQKFVLRGGRSAIATQ